MTTRTGDRKVPYGADPEVKARRAAYAKKYNKTYQGPCDKPAWRAEYNNNYIKTEKGRKARLLANSKRGASVCGREHTITLADIIIPEFCPVYGIKLDCAADLRSPNLPSLDRVDNAKGYIPGNVCVISWQANSDKANLSVENLLALAEYVIRHQAGEK